MPKLLFLFVSLLLYKSSAAFYSDIIADSSKTDENVLCYSPHAPSDELTGILSAFPFSGNLTDCSGNSYNSVFIGEQVWMVENLRTKSYCDGTVIKNVTKEQDWNSIKEGAYCIYDDNDKENYGPDFGYLYNWYAVDDQRQICPKGWHIPSDMEWKTLFDYLGGLKVAGGKLKYDKGSLWKKVNQGATNESGFKAMPGGYRYASGDYGLVGTNAYWWTSTPVGAASAWGWGVCYSNKGVSRCNATKKDGLSVRCIKN